MTDRGDISREQRSRLKRGHAARRAAHNDRLLAGVDLIALDEAMAGRRASREGFASPEPAGGRWVPIGPSVVRNGQAIDNPRVTGRVRDLAVDAAGRRAYAATAKGGVWYTGDGGSTWVPIGSSAERSALPGGPANAQACGCLLVVFGASAESDVVLVGTGEPSLSDFPVFPDHPFAPWMGGVGVLAAIGPAAVGAPSNPWEHSGLELLGGVGTYRLVRDPSPSVEPGVDGDRVLACTTAGAFVGERDGGYRWQPVRSISDAYPGRAVSDAVWLPDGRVFAVVVDGALVWMGGPADVARKIDLPMPEGAQREGVASLARAGGNRMYLLGEIVAGGQAQPALWRIDAPPGSAPMVTPVTGVPSGLWGTQRDYDQALAVDSLGDADRLYLGGSAFNAYVAKGWGGAWCAQLYCFDIRGDALSAVAGVSRTGLYDGGAGALEPGLIGNNVHADVHAIRLAGPPARRQVWVGTDGGVFMSDRAGQVYTFCAMNNGIASLEPQFVRGHPLSSQFVAIGVQDNGVPIRTGDTAWELFDVGDGGGVAFVPTAPHILISQATNAYWKSGVEHVVDPLTRQPERPSFPTNRDGEILDDEYKASSFYSNAAAIVDDRSGTPRTRLAIGTNRLWLSDDISCNPSHGPNTWRVLPVTEGFAEDPRADWLETGDYDRVFGHPRLGAVITMSWASASEIVVLYQFGIVRYTEIDPDRDTWSAFILRPDGAPLPRTTVLTDVCAVPGTRDFYLATTGVTGTNTETLWYYRHADRLFHPTGLRDQLTPRDPVYAVVLDPADPAIVFAGTATGVWRGTRHDTGHVWEEYANGLPQALVQDLSTWTDPAHSAGAPRLLRAGVMSRGVWEVDLAHDASRRTWIRATSHDDRRMPVAAKHDPTPNPAGRPETFTGSPDIAIRPRWTATRPPPPFPSLVTTDTEVDPAQLDRPLTDHELWTFQTAFRWLYPSVVANGRWSNAMDKLVPLHRASMHLSTEPLIDELLWDAVVRTRLTHNGEPTTDPSGTPAVYRTPWHSTRSLDAAPCEADLSELVVPPAVTSDGIWGIYREPCTVDVILHHRDSREVPAGAASVTLLWHTGGRSPATLMKLPIGGIVEYLTGMSPMKPGGWSTARQPLTVPVGGRLPRGTSIEVDLSTAETGTYALLLAFVGSTVDDQPLLAPSIAAPRSVTELVRTWPYLAARVVQILERS